MKYGILLFKKGIKLDLINLAGFKNLRGLKTDYKLKIT